MNRQDWTPCAELAAVAALTAAGITPDVGPRVAAGRVDWIAVATLALSHNVAGLVHRALAAGHAPDVPPPVAQAFARHAAAIAQRNEAALGETLRLRGALARVNVASIPLKGPWLGKRLYADMAARPSRDVDLLVPPTMWREALVALDTAGYPTETGLSPRQLASKARFAGQLVFQRRDGKFVVEPHWAVAPRTLSLDLDHTAFWNRAETRTVDGLALPTIAAEDELILLAVHGFKEEWTRLKWLADFFAFLQRHPQLDWTIVAARARQQGVAGIVDAATALASILFGDTAARASVGAFAPTAAIASVLGRMNAAARKARDIAVETNIYHLSSIRFGMRERAIDRARYVVRSVTTPQERHFRTFRVPDYLFPVYYAIKPLQDLILIPLWDALKRWFPRVHATPKHTKPPAPMNLAPAAAISSPDRSVST